MLGGGKKLWLEHTTPNCYGQNVNLAYNLQSLDVRTNTCTQSNINVHVH